ncbi:hypothetical protein CR513_33228, partial [Mucuna pruriens]
MTIDYVVKLKNSQDTFFIARIKLEREHFNYRKICERSMTKDIISHQLPRNLLMSIIGQQDDSYALRKFEPYERREVYQLNYEKPCSASSMTVAEEEFFIPQRRKKCDQSRHTTCKCKDETMIHFNYKMKGCIRKDHPNPKRESNSSNQSLRANQVKKFLRKDVQVFIKLVSLKLERGIIDVDVCSLPLESGVMTLSIASYRILSLELVELKRRLEKMLEKQFVRLVCHSGSTTLASQEEGREYRLLSTRLDDLVDKTFRPYLDRFVVVLIDDILNWEECVKHLRVVLQALRNKWSYSKMSSVSFGLKDL